MKIVNALTGDKREETCLQFNHKGFIVSVSNFTPSGRCEVLAWKGQQDIRAESIPEIIYKIDNLS